MLYEEELNGTTGRVREYMYLCLAEFMAFEEEDERDAPQQCSWSTSGTMLTDCIFHSATWMSYLFCLLSSPPGTLRVNGGDLKVAHGPISREQQKDLRKEAAGKA